MKRLAWTALAAALFIAPEARAQQGGTVPSAQASRYVGKQVTACGVVVGARFLDEVARQPTFLNFDRPYPDQTFTVVIWGSDRRNFRGAPERLYLRQRVCAMGRVTRFDGRPQMVITSPAALRVTPAPPAAAKRRSGTSN